MGADIVTGDIEEVEARSIDDAAAAALADFDMEGYDDVLPDDPPDKPDEVADHYRSAPAHRDDHLWVVWDERRKGLVGAALLGVEHRDDNPELGEVSVGVRPDARRQGLGTSLLAAVAERAVELGRYRLLGRTTPGNAGEAYAAAVGARPGLVEHQNRVATAALDRQMLEKWLDRAEERASAYSLVAFDDHCPDELVEGYVEALRAMNDAPMDDEMDDFIFTVDELRDIEASMEAKGTTIWTVLARHDETGEIGGLTAFYFGRHQRWLVEQGDTGVLAAHRDRGLGRWLKAANLLRVLDERPDVTTVETWNAGSNAAMLGINHALGFGKVAPWTSQWLDPRTLL